MVLKMEIHEQELSTWPYFAQGARCGHIEGKGRAGNYVIGEELEPSYEAASVNTKSGGAIHFAWARGYRYGYRLAAEGSLLPLEIKNAPLP